MVRVTKRKRSDDKIGQVNNMQELIDLKTTADT